MKRLVFILVFAAGCGGRRPIVHQTPVATPQPPGEVVDPPSPSNPPAMGNPGPAHREEPRPDPEPPKIPRPVEAVIRETNARLEDAFFPYDRAELTDDALAALRRDAELLAPLLAEFPTVKLTVEGHCDERGSAEYNLALGDRRASRAADVLRQFGVGAARMSAISYGKEAPQCTEPSEGCWRKNRRAHLVVGQASGDR